MGGRKGEDWTVDPFFMSVFCVRVSISCSTTSCLISCFSSSILSSGPFNSHPNSHLTHWCPSSLSSVTQTFLVAPFPSTSQQVSFYHMACSSHKYLGSFSDQPLTNTKFCICHYCLYLLHWQCRSLWHLTSHQLHFFVFLIKVCIFKHVNTDKCVCIFCPLKSSGIWPLHFGTLASHLLPTHLVFLLY